MKTGVDDDHRNAQPEQAHVMTRCRSDKGSIQRRINLRFALVYVDDAQYYGIFLA